jgi:glyoxylase-like metal-dependent hydrolase (beta-lactamase superfamily II)
MSASAKSASTARIQSFFDETTATATHVLTCAASGEAAIIDSVLDYDPRSGRTSTASADQVLAHVREAGLKVRWHLETHAHADHLSAAPYLRRELGGRIGIGERICEVQKVFRSLFNAKDMATDGSPFDCLFRDGDSFQVGQLEVRVMATPGHTPACVSYLAGDDVFVGDTLFMPDYGSARCDFPGGDARTLYRSIRRLLSLPGHTRMHLCHDYRPGGRAACWETTVDEQRRRNIHLHDGVSEDDFVAMRNARDKTLSMPSLLLPSVQVNARAGELPPPEDNGTRYLKIPLNAI